MSSRNVKILAILVLVLFAGLFALNAIDRSGPPAAGDLVFPELKTRLNDINAVTITDAEGEITLRREADDDGSSPAARWIAPEFGGYPVDTGTLRRLLLAIADARKVERKTSDPELYERLGVEDPREDGGSGVLVSARGDNAAIALILGDTAQREFRYARIPEEAPSWLISENPTLPAERTGWLLPEIVDIDTSRIASAVIRHADGEVISLRKENADEANFEVENIPEGRELRYPSVANSIASVVSNLNLEDVRRAARTDGPAENRPEPQATAEFRTFDGLELLIRTYRRPDRVPDAETGESQPDEQRDDDYDDQDDDQDAQHWIVLTASVSSQPADEEPASARDRDTDNEAADPDAGPDANTADEAAPSPVDEAAEINGRVSGWTYRIAGYKADQLTRRWEDLLSEPENSEDD